MDKHSAIYKLYPSVAIIRGDVAYDKDEQEVSYDEAKVQAEIDANAYKDLRVTEYPSIADQLDDLFHNGYDGWKETIQTVKDKYPKGVK
jgi:hypothetical protein